MNGGERAVPQNIEAEEALLGALLIDPEAIVRVAPILRPEDFYRERNGVVYAVRLALYNRHEPGDFVTLCDELERQGKLQEVGGAAYLASLVNAVPTTVHAEHYAHIVERCAIMRRLITAAGKIAALGYEEPADVDATLDRSEQILFDVSQRRSSQGFIPLHVALREYFERIDYLHQHKGEIIGVATGFHDLDRLTTGLHGADLVIIAGRPAVGKTAFCLTLARNAAVLHGTPVAIFSLEMSVEQLVQRLLCAEANVDAQRLRSGYIDEFEWHRLSEAFGTLSEAPIFIDDGANATALEVRAKARRLKAEHNVGLVVIDYLQLMHGRGLENRVQEVSEISRGLKGLARELDVPVIALSQLSRAVESRQDHRPVLSDLRESGCLAGETLVYLPDRGIYRRIDQLAGQNNFRVLALNTETWQLERRPVLRAFATGHNPVYRMTTRLGRSLRATSSHQFLTIEGWRRLDQLAPGVRLALPRRLEIGALGRDKPEQQRAITSQMASCPANTNRDVLPREVWKTIAVPAMLSAGLTTRQMHAGLGNAYCGAAIYRNNVSCERAARLARAVRSEELVRLANSDVYWDELVSVVADGEADVYDLTVDGLHNFVANDVIAHNSIEQDADIVIFIHREELYNPNTERKNIADIIVAKHRNGPVGQIPLRFFPGQTRFADLELYRPGEDGQE